MANQQALNCSVWRQYMSFRTLVIANVSCGQDLMMVAISVTMTMASFMMVLFMLFLVHTSLNFSFLDFRVFYLTVKLLAMVLLE